MTAASFSRSSLNRLPDPFDTPRAYAGVRSKRLFAWVIDVVLVAILSAFVLPFTAFLGIFFFPALMLAVGFVYRWWTISNTGATLGMRMMAVELRNADGQVLDSSEAFWHTMGYTISVLVAPLQLISVLGMLFTPKRQGLTDMVMSTAMVNRMTRR